MFIQRKRWIVRRKSDNAIMCGNPQNYVFKDVYDIENARINTYTSEARALFAANKSFGFDETKVVIEPIVEIITSYIEE